MSRKNRRASTSTTDPVTEYARAVTAGAIVAGPHVRDACRRHLDDLERGAARGLSWDLKAALHAIGYFPEVLRLAGGQYEGRPFVPLAWQAFIVGSLFGWKLPDGTRRFRTAFVLTGKGSGKSPLAAGIGLFGLTADDEPRAEIYAAAAKRDQAMVMFRDAVSMVAQSPQLRTRISTLGVGEQVWNLAHRASGSFFRTLSSDDAQSGPRPHIALLDEIHEHRDAVVVEALRAGQKSRRQPLLFAITNSGVDRTSVCYRYFDYGCKVAAGALEDDSFFAYICALDPGDDPFEDEACWQKANPSLPELPGVKYLRDQVAQARAMPGKENVVRRLNFCEWTEADSPWISRDLWFAAEDAGFDAARLAGRACYGGFDRGLKLDLTAFVLVFPPSADDPFHRLLPFFWIPADGIPEREERDGALYSDWVRDEHVFTTPGRAINPEFVARDLAEICAAFDVKQIAFDAWRIEEFKRICENEGIELPLVKFEQSYRQMSPALEVFERLLLEGKVKHFGNDCMAWNCACAVTSADSAGNRKVDKARSTGRVDGVVAAVMACGVVGAVPKAPEYKFFVLGR